MTVVRWCGAALKSALAPAGGETASAARCTHRLKKTTHVSYRGGPDSPAQIPWTARKFLPAHSLLLSVTTAVGRGSFCTFTRLCFFSTWLERDEVDSSSNTSLYWARSRVETYLLFPYSPGAVFTARAWWLWKMAKWRWPYGFGAKSNFAQIIIKRDKTGVINADGKYKRWGPRNSRGRRQRRRRPPRPRLRIQMKCHTCNVMYTYIYECMNTHAMS